MKAKLNKIKKRTLVSETTDQILNYISRNHLKAEDRLPSETELASMLGISRSVIREALSRLHYIGLIESWKKSGIVVKMADPLKIFDKCMPFVINQPEIFEDLTTFRYILEAGAIELVIENGTQESIDDIRKFALICKAKADKEASHKEILKADEAFHISILRASGNEFLTKMTSIIIKHFKFRNVKPHKIDHYKMIAEAHLSMVNAIMKKDFLKAHDLMKRHLKK